MLQPVGVGALSKFGVNISGAVEEVSWTLYDYLTYAAAGQTELRFFQTPNGQGTKTLADTNMTLAGQIPSGQNFLVMAIALDFYGGENPERNTAAADVGDYLNDNWVVSKGGYLEFQIGSKLYKQEGPLGAFPTPYRLAGQGAAASTVAATSYVQDYAAMSGQLHAIIPTLITSNQNFSVSLKWPTAVALTSGSAGRIGARLIGRLFRNAQ